MVTRLMLPLRRVANSPGSIWSLGDIVEPEDPGFANDAIGETERVGDSIRLKHLPSKGKSLALPEP